MTMSSFIAKAPLSGTKKPDHEWVWGGARECPE
jgi:hypothetical protein